jgi:hypothetical protein
LIKSPSACRHIANVRMDYALPGENEDYGSMIAR